MKKIKFLILAIALMFFNVIFVKAALPTSLGPIDQIGNKVTDDCGGESCYALALKVSGSTPVICTEYYKSSPAGANGGSGATCTIISDWDEKVRYGVAAIINKAKGSINATSITNQYFAAEMAINRFLNDKNAGGAAIAGTALTSTYSSLYTTYLAAANAAYDSYATDSKVAITLSTSSLTFTLNGSEYHSNNVTVSGVDSYTVSPSVGTVSKSGNTFKVVVPASSINEVTTVNVTVSSSKTLDQARNYNCGSSYQTITPVSLETITKSDRESVSGTISPKSKLTINKVDGNNSHLSGATITVTGTKGYSKTFTTTGAPIVIGNLEYDTYTIKETKAPEGYALAASKTVTLSSSSLSGTVTLTNTKNKVTISKLDVTGTSELAGATLEIQNAEGKTIHKWVSTTTPKVIEGMPKGKYYLVETIAPEGYVLNKEKVEFEITETTTTKTVKMTNKLNVVKILKINSVDKKLLAGATLEIQDKDGKIVKYCTDSQGNKNTECKWVSTDKAYEIEGMPKGKYYLVETKAPEGYVLNKEKIEFQVNEKTDVIEVEMENELEVEVPDTLSSRSTLLIAISMFDIALGIGILTYVKKNKIEE